MISADTETTRSRTLILSGVGSLRVHVKAALDFQATATMTLEFLVGNIAARSKFALGVICCLPIQITAASSLLDLQVKSDLLVALAGLQGFLFACQTYFLGTKRGVEEMKQISCIIFWKGAKMF